ncbi:hypothetical protein SERLA73DRAFT_79310 [Serpula lacrymans var. lacrymans S7.3]|uniref:Protein kinase domain-containing protein n=2 Tax=Serpula lacrymans var. lacrymans TaxID=341189 RepID=F8QFZ1_SERL3|nr:uncharacterized protein SERLADRAFT_436216 [Serpula lacrymans var. lacrymans S7.9]EGN92739.1 hypothetical protein SERLA73DRAFT_79310 [Serpula lacrymans var. lacrymans S7.3]EGO26400.1 hypothetical protein SERLADRAFT_436216 [Serpula lacrymans var. lacrymans S7.9]
MHSPIKIQDLTGKVVKSEKNPFGRGGFAQVFKGEYTKDSVSPPIVVAIKVLRPSYDVAETNKLNAKLLREGRVWSALKHPNITPFYGVCYDLGILSTPCLVCPYYKNGSVPEYLRVNPAADRMELTCQLATGLAYLHSQHPSIIHADIKAANVLVNDRYEACLADFGLSRMLETSGFTTTTIGGTSRWMAHELIILPDDYDDTEQNTSLLYTTATDVWAFAMTVLEILTSRIPFVHLQSEVAVILAIKRGGRPLHESYPEIRDSIWSMLVKCWETEPGRRPSMNELSQFLHHKLAKERLNRNH